MVIGVGKRNVNEVWIIEIFDINKVDVGIWIFIKRKINVFYFLYMWKLWILFFYRKLFFRVLCLLMWYILDGYFLVVNINFYY